MPVVVLDQPSTLPTPGPIAIIRPSDGEPWALSASVVGVVELYATADPQVVCVAEQFEELYLVDVRDPGSAVRLGVPPVRVRAAIDHGLLLVTDFTRIHAVGPTGIAWRSEELVTDDLKITRADGDVINFRGLGGDYEIEVRGVVDARTGELWK
jgi:hypothetical protein